MKRIVCLLAMCALFGIGCKGSSAKVEQSVEVADSATTTQDALLDALLDELWALNMKTYPQWATYDGVRDYDSELADNSPEALERYIVAVEAIAVRAKALPEAQLSPMARDTRRILLLDAEQMRAEQVCESELWSISGLGGPQVSFPMMPVFHTIRSQDDVETLVARYQKTGKYLDQHIANLRAGLAKGLVAPKINVERPLRQLDKLIALPVDEEHPMLRLKLTEESVSVDDTKLREAVTTVVVPALTRMFFFLVVWTA